METPKAPTACLFGSTVLTDTASRGVVYAKTAFSLNPSSVTHLVSSLTAVNPLNSFAEDSEYAFYKNIFDDPEYQDIFATVLRDIQPHLEEYFCENIDEIQMDDAFAVHYNETHHDSTVKKHQDPSDITVNLNLERTNDLKGSQVKFYGTKKLKNVVQIIQEKGREEEVFLVDTPLGFCTIHWGAHPHEVTPLERGRRTNIVMTYIFKDKSKSDATRNCYEIEK